MDLWQIIVLVVVVLVVLAAIAALMSRRRQAQRLQEAEVHRSGAREELRDLQHQRADADAAEARAQAAKAEAERAELAAREARETEQLQHARAEDRIREADRLDPRVDHTSDDYQPGYDRVVPDQQTTDPGNGTTGTPGTTTTTGTTGHPSEGAQQVDPETGRPVEGDPRY